MGGHAGHKRPNPLYDAAVAAAGGYLSSRVRQRIGGSKTCTMMDTDRRPMLVEPGEFTREHKRRGRYKRRSLRNAYKLITVGLQPNYFRYTAIKPWNTSTGGYFPMYNHINSTANVVNLPLYIFDLTQCPNLNNGSLVNPFPLWAINRNTASNVTPNAVPCQYQIGFDQTGVVTSDGRWVAENLAGASATANPPFRYAMHKFSDIRLMLYGCTTIPVKWDIAIVSFPDDEYNPFYLQQNMNANFTAPGSTVGGTPPNVTALIDYLVQPYTYSPLAVQDTQHMKHIHYHYRRNVIIQPQFSNENDVNPHFKEFKLFQKWDRKYKFDWSDSGIVGATQGAGFEQIAGQTFPCPHYKARRYLMLRATAGQTSAAGVPTYSKTINPSFDIVVRNKWMTFT